MDIFTRKGEKVVVTDVTCKNGYDPDIKNVVNLLEINKPYTVDRCVIHKFYTDVYLVEFPGVVFNSVNFENYREDLEDKKVLKKVFQRVVASDGTGDCVRAAVASIMGMEYEDIPDMSPNTGNQAGILMNFMKEHDYHYGGVLFNKNYNILLNTIQFDYCKKDINWVEDCLMSNENINKLKGINGLFLATVLSPKFTDPYNGKWGHHQVICDSNFNVVFDPGPEYQDLKRYPLDKLLGFNGICHIDIYEKPE